MLVGLSGWMVTLLDSVAAVSPNGISRAELPPERLRVLTRVPDSPGI